MSQSSWPTEWVRAVLPSTVLGLISDEETYGYLIAQRLAEAGFGTVKGSALYPLLMRLENDGLIAATWREGDGGPGRKYYSITETGRERLIQHQIDWASFTQRTAEILSEAKDAQ